MAKSFRCKLVTPTAALVDDELVYASVPAWDGLMGVMPGRAPILARLGLGELRLDFADSKVGEGGSRRFAVDGGFVKMADNQLTILAEMAVPAENLVLADAEGELRKAESATLPGEGTPQARTAALEKKQHNVQRAALKVNIAKKKSGI